MSVASVGRDAFIVTPSRLERADALYRSARTRGVEAGVVADDYGLGKGGELSGYSTYVSGAIHPVSGTIGIIPEKAVIWKTGRRRGYRLHLSTGHVLVVAPEHTLLVTCKDKAAHMPVSELVDSPESCTVPVYMLTYPRRSADYRQLSVVLAVLLLASRLQPNGDVITVEPITPSLRPWLAELLYQYKYCIPEPSSGEITVYAWCLRDMVYGVPSDIYEAVSLLPLPLLAEAAYLLATRLYAGVEVTGALEERLPLLAVALQHAGRVLRRVDERIEAVRWRKPYIEAEITVVKEVEDEFYTVTPLSQLHVIANGLLT